MKTSIALALMAGAASAASADVTYLSQERFVKADRIGTTGVDFFTAATDFGPFDMIVDTPMHECDCDARAEIASELKPEGMSASGLGRGVDGRQFYGGDGESVFDVVFEVTGPTPYKLVGSWAIGPSDTFEPEVAVELSDFATSGTIFESKYTISSWPIMSSESFDATGILPAGSYRMYARAQADYWGLQCGIGCPREASYTFAITFPSCLADLTVDGQVDFSDYLEFLNYYDQADPRVDFTGDGIVDFSDYLEYLNLFEQGC